MTKLYLTLIFALLMLSITSAQDCNCISNYEWVKKTFEENDAGFEYALKAKGEQAYAAHNKRMMEKAKKAKTLAECAPILYEWLTFFRTGHIAIRLKNQYQPANNAAATQNEYPDWEAYTVDTAEFKDYLNGKTEIDYEGIWETEPYTIGIKKQDNAYIGFIIESGAETWTKGQVKLRFTFDGAIAQSVFYMRDHSAMESEKVSLIGKNHIQIGDFYLSRLYPKVEDEAQYTQFFRMLESNSPYMERLNETTLYLRIPSFLETQKQAIDSVIEANRELILSTENLIIDIRNGTGGSDNSYEELIPLLYTNPIREVGTEYLSTSLNNQRMLDFINNPEYGFNEEDKMWAKTGFEKLSNHLGEFVNLDTSNVSIIRYDTVYPYPKNVGIIINQQNGSTDEQFLLAAKQSRKVKLFGTTTFGVLDVSNMYFVLSPCGEFELGYSLSRSMRIPEFCIDGKGIQPDYYLDKGIPEYQWTQYVNSILNGR